MPSRRIDPSSARVEKLYDYHTRLEARTDLKVGYACGSLLRPCATPTQEMVAALLCGTSYGKPSLEVSEYLFQWMLANAGTNVDQFDISNVQKQWPSILSGLLGSAGRFSELFIAEHLLHSISENPGGLLRKILLADRIADAEMKTDLVLHRDMPNGILQLGVQVKSSSNHVEKTLREINSGCHQDRRHLATSHLKIPQKVCDLLRHGTIILSYPHLTPSPERVVALRHQILSGKITEKPGEYILGGAPNTYSRFTITLLQYFHQYIIQRLVDDRIKANRKLTMEDEIDPMTIIHFEFVPHNPKTQTPGHIKICYIQKQRNGIRRNLASLLYAVEKDGNFLDLYRDMAGVRAK